MPRILRLTPRFDAAVRRVGIASGTATGRALGTTLAGIAKGELPGPLDYEAAIPPTRTAWVRRVPGHNLWIFYTFDVAAVRAVALTGSPPIPVL